METKDKLNKNKNNIEKTIFNETVKKKIEKYSSTNTSLVLPGYDTTFNMIIFKEKFIYFNSI